MNIRFWGVRGSIPTPVTPSRIKSKISAIVEQITPEDLESAESRERFLAGLPPWLFGAVGGNSPCLSVDFGNSSECIVFDCGSGIREFGMTQTGKKKNFTNYHIFMSHFHWDHMQGLPFFGPCYNPSLKIDFYSPVKELEEILSGQMVSPYFPVRMDTMRAKKTFHHLENEITVCGRKISFKKMNHPGDSYAYCVNENGKRFIYSTDTELTADDFMKTEENTAFFKDADLIVVDCQYTLGEAIDKYNWGHSAFSLAVDFAANWGIKHMVMFHHDPTYDDHKLYGILQSARWYLERMNIKGIELTLAYEGLEISI
ncbi:MAG: MBL fold metallo-hydrolase [Treponema sp.]|jgi:phosphoribosyl 1,2-cyclic phosphodiesterase|nr:MBL fold metallo-hydrolase [Treponema sp.]